MKQNITTTSLIFAAALALGLATAASAQSANVAVPTPDTTRSVTSGGLLGQRYTGVEFTYNDLTDGSPGVSRGFRVEYNQPIAPLVDLNADYGWSRADVSGFRLTGQGANIGATAYAPLGWGKPFVLAAAGWQWVRGGGTDEDSFAYKVGTGVEFQVAPSVVVTPFANFVRATAFNSDEIDLGAKAEYRLTREWSLTGRAQYEAVRRGTDAVEVAAGVNYRF